MTLEQLMAFTVTSTMPAEQVWDAIKDGWQKEPYTIRRLLTETTAQGFDKRAVFVGIDAYEEAGGCILRDLFQQDEFGGWLQDPVLLDRLANEKLKSEAEAIAAEGWKWVEVAMTFPYGHDHGLRQLVGTTVDLAEEERTTREALRDEYRDRLEAEYAEADELPDEVDTRLGEIEKALEAFERRPMTFDPDQTAKAGVFVSIDADGTVLVERGYVRPEDEAPVDPGAGSSPETGEVLQRAGTGVSHQRAVITLGGHPGAGRGR